MVARAGAPVVSPWPIGAVARQTVSAPPWPFARAGEALGDAALLLMVTCSLPFVIILAGAPLALLITLLLRLGGVR